MLQELAQNIEGEVKWDSVTSILYATDASAYREKPLGVAFPKTNADIKTILKFCYKHNISIIPRAAGTSLAGQVVGNGLVVDISRHFGEIIEINPKEKHVIVQPGVIRDELNAALKPHGVFFGPETSTSNRCMIGGMLGNNSCGARSLVYGSLRDHIISVKGFFSNGEYAELGEIKKGDFQRVKNQQTNLGGVLNLLDKILSPSQNRAHIQKVFPKANIPRRNTGYAIDILAQSNIYDGDDPFNLAKLIAGSEGTLFFATEIKLGLVELPPPASGLLCAHFKDVNEALLGNLKALEHTPTACELIDHYVLNCTKENIEQKKNRFFVQGDPGAILIIELTGEHDDDIQAQADLLTRDLKMSDLGYAYSLVLGEDVEKVWALRKAGLGLLSNIPGDAKPVPVIEDTAVDVKDLPDFISEFNLILNKYKLYCVHYAHAATGELHLRPIINLKTQEGVTLFRVIATEIAGLVKKYKGSLSGEHGDGRLRGEFIPTLYGEDVYQWFKEIKQAFDPKGILNPGKITDTPPMDNFLRYKSGQETPDIITGYRFEQTQGYIRAIEACNGSGDCRKTEISGGIMCPSYMVTKNEQHTTRGRANVLREWLTQSTDTSKVFGHPDVEETLDLCLSCKGCKSECPSNVDMARIKSEYLYQRHQLSGVPLAYKMIGRSTFIQSVLSKVPWVYNSFFRGKWVKKIGGIHKNREIPRMSSQPFSDWFKKNKQVVENPKATVTIISDEFTEFLDAHVGQATVKLLNKLGYQVDHVIYMETGRVYMSKGMLKRAKKCCNENLRLFSIIQDSSDYILGIEPSAMLSFRDEYPDLCDNSLIQDAKNAKENILLIDEFLSNELDSEKWGKTYFKDEEKAILIHGHCHQKVLSNMNSVKKILNVPKNYSARLIPSGCCGMAGSFGYEKDHYDLSMEVGELVLFPSVKSAETSTIISAGGFSCRHQIYDGTGKKGKHPVEILLEATV